MEIEKRELMVQVSWSKITELIEKAERCKAIERMIGSGRYVSVDDIAAVLGIERKENTK